MKRIVYALLPLAFVASAVHAAEYSQVIEDESRIEFSYTQMGVTMKGSFNSFSSELRFDPDAPRDAHAAIDVDLASVDTGSADGNEEVVRKTWFNTAAFPVARFESTAIEPLAEGEYEVSGVLSIKGASQEVSFPATFTPRDGVGIFDGSLTIQRGDFAIGEGAWRAFDIVANDVVIQFHIAAAAE